MRLYKNHQGTVGYWDISVTDNAELRIANARKLDGKETVRLVPVKGKNIGKANETTPLQQAEKEMASRIQKQKDKGYVEDEATAASSTSTNALGQPKPMLATVYSKVKPDAIDWANAYLQPKLNGHRCLATGGTLYSRGGKAIKLPHILKAIADAGMNHLHLDGELYAHGMPLEDIGSLIKRPREESEQLVYWVYDILDTGMSFRERFISCPMLSGNAHIKIVPTFKVRSPTQAAEKAAEWVGQGYEGAVLREGLQGYEADKRSRHLLKMKEYTDSEAEVVSVRAGTPFMDEAGKMYQVPVYTLKNRFGGPDFEVTAPGTREEKDRQWTDRDSAPGRTLTFKYFELSSAKVPLQPVALRFREDV